MAIKKLRAARVNTISAEEYVGQDGDIFWDVNTGAFRISDGVTPGGYFPPSYSTIANFGDFTAVENTLSTTNNNEDMNLVTQGTGALNFYGGGGFVIHTDGPDSPAAFSVQPNGFTTVYVPNLVTGDSGVVINASDTGYTLPTQVQGVPLHIVGQEDKLAPINVDSFGAGVNPGLTGRAARGTALNPSSTQTGDVIARFAAVGYGNTAYTIDPSATNGKAPTDIRFVALENFTDAHSGSQIQFATAAIGSTTRQVVATLDTTTFSTSADIHTSGNLTVNGNEIVAKQLIITQAGNIAFNDGSIQTTAAIQTIDNLDHITGAFAVVGITRHLQLSSDATPSNTPGTIVSRNNQGNVSVGNITATNISTTSVTGNAQIAGSMFIAGNLLVNGTTTSVNSGAVSIGTKTLTVSNAAATSSQADGSAFLVGNDGVYGDWTFDSVQAAWRSNINIVPAQASTGSIGSNDRHWAGVYTNICNVDTQLQVGDNPFAYIVDSLGQFTGNGNAWSMVSTQNLNMGNNASSDFVAIADNGNDVTNFIDMGINSSTYNQTAYGVMKPLDGYLFTNGGNLVIGTQSTQKDIVFFTGGSTSDKGAGRIIGTGQRWLIGTPADDGVSKLQVQGNILAGNITATNLTNTFTSLQNQITGANSAIVTANTAMKSYVDAVTTAWTANAATQHGQITTLQGQVYTNSNVAAYLPTYTGNITAGNVNTTAVYGDLHGKLYRPVRNAGTIADGGTLTVDFLNDSIVHCVWGNGMNIAYTNYTAGRIVKVMATKATGTGTDSLSLDGVTASQVSNGSASLAGTADQTVFMEIISTNGTLAGVFVKL